MPVPGQIRGVPARPALLALVVSTIGFGAFAPPADDDAWPVTSGAAPGYVPDAACGDCHEALAESYREVSMSRSLYRLTDDNVIEDWDEAHFFHEPSGNHYEMFRRDGAFVHARYRVDADGQEYARIEREVDWVLGSGSNARNYLFRSGIGELYELPMVWYSKQQRWAMAPGFDRADHDDFARRLGRRCLGCHNAYPDVPAGADAFDAPLVFPETLPHGIGCQRCHGPGAEHVRLAEEGAPDGELLASIVNPARLEPARRSDVCNQCHLQAVTSVDGFVEVFGRGAYGFEPGESLGAFRHVVDLDEGVEDSERFEINHHPYRLAQSRCFVESGGELSCLTCHDPHRKVQPSERREHYRDSCLSCHDVDVCSMTPEHASSADVEPDDCAACHMPKHRTRDVVQVLVTDHRIRRSPAPADWSAPREEGPVEARTAELYEPELTPEGPVGELYLLTPKVRLGEPLAIARFAELLEDEPTEHAEPWVTLGDAYLDADRPDDAVEAFDAALARRPDSALVLAKRAVAHGRLGRLDAAVADLERATGLEPTTPDFHVDLGRAWLDRGEAKLALAPLERATELRPQDHDAWLQLGAANALLGQTRPAIAAFRAARTADPRRPDAHYNLAKLLVLRGSWSQALRTLRRGVDCVPDDPPLAVERAIALLVAPLEEAEGEPEAANGVALRAARRAVELAPEDPRALLAAAFAELGAGDPAEASRLAQEARSAGADPTAVTLVDARASRELGRDAQGPSSGARKALEESEDPLLRHVARELRR